MTPDALLRHSLTLAGTDMPRDPMAGIDSAPPEQLLRTLAERTAVPEHRVRRMTLAGWEPWLIEPVGPEPGKAFENYVLQHSVLLGPTARPRRLLSGWRPWLPADPRRIPMRRACPSCISSAQQAARSFTLVSQIPLTLTCPDHGCRLEPAFGAPGICFFWESPETAPAPAPAAVVAMDRLTHAALQAGTVALPRRTVHAGVWFRLLRTLIDEISIPLSKLPARSRRSVTLVWEAAGHPLRAGVVGAWRAYEALPWPRQQATLEAASAALHLIETGEITAEGTLGALLTAEPHRPLPDGRTPEAVRAAELNQALEDALAAARADPLEAHRLLALLAPNPGSKRFATVREDLIMLGIPEQNLPTQTEAMRLRAIHRGSHASRGQDVSET
ncbi:hypothetical protein GCM10028789_00620 [Sinomonas halotolerans]